MGKYTKFSFVVLLLLVVATNLAAADNLVLLEQAFSYVGEDGHLVIKFQKPMGYVSHFPPGKGKTLVIKMKDLFPGPPPTQDAGNQLPQQPTPQVIKERLVVPESLNTPVVDIVYEQNGSATGVLTVQFTREIEYTIEFSRDRKSLTVILKKIQTDVEGLSQPKGLSNDLPVYSINLLTSTTPIDTTKQPALVNFKAFDIYTEVHKQPGRKLYTLHLGYFYSASVANANLKRLKPFYPTAWVSEIKPEKRKQADDWFFNTRIAQLKKRKAEKPPGKSEVLLERAKQAMIDKDYGQAIRYFTRIQELGEVEYQQETLELLGLARERNGQLAHAKAEYEEYLRRYPEGEDAERVRQRLFGLVTARSATKEKIKQEPKTVEPEWEFFGSLYQFYRRQTTVLDNSDVTVTDSSVYTDLLYTGRKRGLEYDQRFNISGKHQYNFLDDVNKSDGDFYTFYYDVAKRDGNYGARVGRQAHNSDGVLGRFDGVIFNKAIGTDMKVNFLYGYPVELNIQDSLNTDRQFYGISYDINSLFSNTDFKFYYLSQTNNGLTDRTALGTEIKSLREFSSYFFLFDYDIFYSKINIATFVGTWRNEANSTLNFIADYRQNPVLTTNNALIGQPVTSMEELKQLYTDDEIYQLARDRTSAYTSFSLSASTILTDKYQINGDITLSHLDDTVASFGVPAAEGTGNDMFYSVSLVATNFFTDSDLTIFSARYNDTDASKTSQLGISSKYTYNSKWRINPRLIYEYQDRTNDTNRTIWLPRLVVDYRWTKSLKLELDTGYRTADTSSSNVLAASTEEDFYIYLGYIYDF